MRREREGCGCCCSLSLPPACHLPAVFTYANHSPHLPELPKLADSDMSVPIEAVEAVAEYGHNCAARNGASSRADTEYMRVVVIEEVG